MILLTGRNVFGGWIGSSKSPFKTSTGAADEVSMTPIMLAMTIDFENFISSRLIIIWLSYLCWHFAAKHATKIAEFLSIYCVWRKQ
jgi:hypothetical protein